jgi:hypothetical protein
MVIWLNGRVLASICEALHLILSTIKKKGIFPSVVAHTSNPSICKVEAGGLRVQGQQLGLHNETLSQKRF